MRHSRSCPFPFCFSLKSSAAKPHFCQALPLKCAVRIFRTSATCRASEGGKNEFLRVRRARDFDTLPQKERKPRLKKTISPLCSCAITRRKEGVSDEERRLFIAGSILCVCDQEKRRLDKVSRALFAALVRAKEA